MRTWIKVKRNEKFKGFRFENTRLSLVLVDQKIRACKYRAYKFIYFKHTWLRKLISLKITLFSMVSFSISEFGTIKNRVNFESFWEKSSILLPHFFHNFLSSFDLLLLFKFWLIVFLFRAPLSRDYPIFVLFSCFFPISMLELVGNADPWLTFWNFWEFSFWLLRMLFYKEEMGYDRI